MQNLSILSILLLAALTVSTIALPLTSDEKSSSSSKSTQTELSKGQDQVPKSNERQGRVWSPFGAATESRRGRFNRDLSEISSATQEKEQKATKVESTIPEKSQVQTEKSERQGRVWSPFGAATESRRGRFNRDVNEKTSEISSAAQEKPTKVESKIPEKSQVQTEKKEREGRSWSPFGAATESRRGRFNRDVESSSNTSENLVTKTGAEKVSEKPKSNERQGRVWSPFGKASASGRGLFNV